MTEKSDSLPISVAEGVGKECGLDQVIIVGRKVGGSEHVLTWGRSRKHAVVAASTGDFIKHKIMGWPALDNTLMRERVRLAYIAPDLLWALKLLLEPSTTVDELNQREDEARAIIAKAEAAE